MQRQSLNGVWQFSQAGKNDWLPGPVPGDVHTALLAAGRIPDPYLRDNEKRVQWIAESDWDYRREFTADAAVLGEERVFLVCDGLDTLAHVYLNGKLVGEGKDMFQTFVWDVKSLVKPGQNELLVHFDGPMPYVHARQAVDPMVYGGDLLGGPHLRKSPYMFGWDWGPRLPPVGIWKDIALVGYSTARVDDLHLIQKLEAGKGVLTAAVQVDAWSDAALQVTMTVSAPAGTSGSWEAKAPVQSGSASVQVEIADPQIWWPNGYGSQPLYDVTVTLKAGEKTLETRTYKIGFRTIELRREPDQWGECFTFVVNGVPVFAKGSDWIPADFFPTRITRAHIDGLMRSAVDAHMNMLRVWGGGLYESEDFYDLCDQYGILVWQDFIFACGTYPDDPELFENVRIEAVQNVRRLRHRTSLAMWCGNNEMEQGWADWGYNKPDDYRVMRLKHAYDRMFHHVLPEICAAEDPSRPYWPSSASSGIPFDQPNGQLRGDTHYWDVWHGRKPFTAYRSQFPRFMSEFGFQALPTYETVKTYADPEDRNMTSMVMEHHQRSGTGNTLMMTQMCDTFRMPKDFESLVYLSMVLQGEGIRYGVEHWRRNMNRVSGTLIWQLNDCWQVASWSSLDYFGRWKALHYEAKRFYAPVLLSIEDSGMKMGVHVTSDLVKPFSGQATWQLVTLDGTVLDSGKADVNAAPLADTPVFDLDFTGRMSEEETRRTIFTCELTQDGKRIARCMATFVPNKHLELVDPGLTLKCSSQDGKLAVEVTSKTAARFVELSLEGGDTIFSDNYFDLPAKSSAVVTCALPQGWTFEQASSALRAKSLYNSFA